ncbi:MAG: UDP-N-acetylglucosamine 1-carboxyvinyltransferase [Alphaproteobacteria bacterium]
MDRIRIRGGRPLSGEIRIAGAKNAALPLMAACLLTDEPLNLRNVPHLVDIVTMTQLLAQHGAAASTNGLAANGLAANGGLQDHTLTLHARDITSTTAPYDIVRKMRASVLVLGPLLARAGKATVSLPGGCAIGTRPVDLHIKGLQQLGAEIELTDGYIHAAAPNGLTGATIRFPKVSVGATENLLMAASLARGETVLENVAREPEITDLAICLSAMGAHIDGVGSDTLVIQGQDRLHGAEHSVLPDRIETATYAIAGAVCGGDLTLTGARMELIEATVGALDEAGISVDETETGLRVRRNGPRARGIDVTTQPYPGFPTDAQAQMMALMCVAEGASMMTETIFENRYMHVPELARMGADIAVKGSVAMVRGVAQLSGAPVMATDLRASVSLVLAGLAAEGETTISRVYHLDRGYERLEEKLSACGADIERLSS